MGKGYRAGIGGASVLNFAVVGGTTRPESPKENTIWVNMSTALADYTFSDTKPENPVHGSVWICIGSSGSLSFNALKKNCIELRPVKAYRYIDTVVDGETVTSWDEKEAQLYQNGEWLEWTNYLFTPGNLCDVLTGGWSGIEDGAESISLSYSAQQDYGASVATKTNNLIDLTGLTVLGANVTSYNETFELRVKDSADTVVASSAASATGEVTLDITDLTGEYYIELYSFAWDHGTEGDSYVNVYFDVNKVWLA